MDAYKTSGDYDHYTRPAQCLHANQPTKNRLNWQVTPVLMLFHIDAVAALFFFTWPAVRRAVSVMGDEGPWPRHLLSPTAHPSLLCDAQVV